ncbi:MAG: hypothetical protein LBG19_12180 [Prevotellaceae bacterium]|jgi:ligand-binding sensor domain-containing protein/signal transduction histidine kinase|nr:hypothetical protein [Prevotellaceae bacterium]
MRHRLVSKNILTFLLLLAVTVSHSKEKFSSKQDYYTAFKNIDISNGLSSNLVLNIIQDKYGIMWFATGNGLTRYDGHSFTIYQKQKENEQSLSDNFVTSLAEDIYGNLWVGTRNGLNLYDRELNRFTGYYYDPNNKNSLRNNYIKALHADKEGNLWVETSQGFLSKLNIKSKVWEHTHHFSVQFEGDYYYHHIFEDSKGNLWIAGRCRSLIKIPAKNINIVQDVYSWASCSVERQDGELFFGSYNKFFERYSPQTDSAEICANIDVGVTSATCDKNGILWFGGKGGIALANLERNEIIQLNHNSLNPQSIASDEVLCLYKDRNNCIWIGTDKGISMYSEDLNIFRHYRQLSRIQNSMTSNAVTALMQDADGLIWVGTPESGVDTFSVENEKFGNLTYNLLTKNIDKRTFDRENPTLRQYFRHEAITSQNASLKEDDIFRDYQHFQQAPLVFSKRNENKVSALYQDKEGKIYVGLWTHLGFNTYDKIRKEFNRHALWGVPHTRYMPYILEGNPYGGNWYNDFLEDNRGNLWCATWEATGLNLFDREKGEFTQKHYTPTHTPRKYHFPYLSYDSIRQRMFIETGAFYGYYSLKTKSFNKYSQPVFDSYTNSDIFKRYAKYSDVVYAKSFPINFSRTGSIIHDDIMWITTFHGLVKHTFATDNFEIIKEYDKAIPNTVFTKGIQKQNIWVGRGNLLEKIDVKVNKVHSMATLDETITSLYEDRSGILWIGSKKGMYIFDTEKRQLGFSDLGFINVRSIVGDHRGFVYVANSNGLTKFDGKKIVKEYPFSYMDANGIIGSSISRIYIASDSSIWLATDQGLAKLNPITNEVTTFTIDSSDQFSLLDNNIIDICEDGEKNIWVSTGRGICTLKHNTGTFIDLSKPDDKTVVSRLLSCLMQDRHGNIWIGSTEEGISVLNLDTDRFKHYRHETWNDNSISDNYIAFIYEDSRFNIWVGTRKGINRYNPNKDSVERIEQLSEYQTLNMQEDRFGYLWVSTNDGLFCLDSLGKIIRKYANFPGMQSNEFNSAGCKLNNGYLAFGGDSGFNIFNPEKLINNSFNPKPIVFSNLIVRDSTHYFDLNGLETICLSYLDNDFSITFCSTDYEYANLISYRYKLDGVDDSWSYTSAPILTAKYNSIPFGSYTFTVEASNCFGEWVGATRSLTVNIAAPWYYRWWFFALFAVIIVGVIYSIIRIRERQLKLENIRLESIVEERTSELRNTNQKLLASEKELRSMNDSKNKFFSIISHDLRNPLKALNLTTRSLYEQYDSLSEDEKYSIISIIHKTTNKTGMLLENLLTWVVSQMNLLKPHLKKAELSAIVDSNIEFMQIEAQKKKVNLASNVTKSIYVLADGNLLSTIFRNLISNAIRYSFPGSTITISAKDNNDVIEVSVADQGIGISPENIKRIFSLDSKIQTKGTDNEQGTGLGLIITHEFVQLHGGKIWVESEVNKGTIFIFTLWKFSEDDRGN